MVARVVDLYAMAQPVALRKNCPNLVKLSMTLSHSNGSLSIHPEDLPGPFPSPEGAILRTTTMMPNAGSTPRFPSF